MKPRTLSLAISALITRSAFATLPVVDYSHIGQDAVHQVVNVAHYAATEANTLNGYLTAIKQYEAQIVGLSRMGDLSALRSLPGMSTVADLAGTTGQLYRDYQQLQQLTDPRQYQQDLNSILSSYQNRDWQGWVTSNGTHIQPDPSYYQWDTARWNLANHVGDVLQQLQEKRAALQAQRDQVARLHEGATDQAQQAKYASQRDALDQAIAQVDQQCQQAMAQHKLQTERIYAGQQVSQSAAAERNAAGALQSVDNDPMNNLPFNRGPVHFRGN